ncbi:MAG: TetR/AcrR family transcriptional regulator [Fretibacterium sp.]|nr:TetR/AcrR family transcriptional regulator [Fretibacterium sp.]
MGEIIRSAAATRQERSNSATRRERSNLKAEKRRRLVEAAIDEFSENGLENASYNRIIERSGLSKGAVYYYFDNKDALLGIVMEEIGERVLAAVPERPLPVRREEYWEAVWGYRQSEVDFFKANPALGRVLIMSLGGRELATEELERLYPALGRLVQRQKDLIRRGQELGAVRDDLSVDAVFEMMRTIDRMLCVRFFGHGGGDAGGLEPDERTRRSQDYARLFRDLVQRMLLPENRGKMMEEELIDVERIAVGAE